MLSPSRRTLLTGQVKVLAALAAAASCEPAEARAPSRRAPGEGRDLVCVVRYQLAPADLAGFRRYARAMIPLISRAGGRVLGYFEPDDDAGGLAVALIGFHNLRDYQACRTGVAGLGPTFGVLGHGAPASFIRTERWTFHRRVVRDDVPTA